MSIPVFALLHGGDFSWARFEVHLSTLIGCVLLVAAYYHIVVRWRPVGAARATRLQQTAFVGGTVLLFLSLNGPLHDLSDNFLFSAHMIQHLIMTLIVAPLWLLGVPSWGLRPLLRHRASLGTARFLTNPLVAFALYSTSCSWVQRCSCGGRW
jgi:putative membrane protein